MNSFDMYLFNLDDTLIQTFNTVSRKHYPRLAKLFGVSYPGSKVVRQHWGEDLKDSLKAIFGAFIDQDKAVSALQLMHLEESVDPINGVQRILDILKKNQKFIGLYSSSHPALMQARLCHSLSCSKEDFDFVFNTTEQQIPQPSPHMVFMMMEAYRRKRGSDVDLDQVLVVGDSVADYQMARNAGVRFAAVLTGLTMRDDFLQAGLDGTWIFPSVKEIMTPPSSHGIVAMIQNEKGEFLLLREARIDHPYWGHWSGPHGKCQDEDILEEETVVRETQEECGVSVKAIRKLYTRPADTEVSTVSFWQAKLLDPERAVFHLSRREVDAMGWFALPDILSGKIPLYHGTQDFFDHYQ